MVCRNKERGEAAVRDVQVKSKNEVSCSLSPSTTSSDAQRVFLHIVDMADAFAVRRFAQDFITSGEVVDVLVRSGR